MLMLHNSASWNPEANECYVINRNAKDSDRTGLACLQQGYLIRNTQYVIRNTQYFTVLAKQQQYSGQKYVDLKLVRFQTVWYQNSIQHKQNVQDNQQSNGCGF